MAEEPEGLVLRAWGKARPAPDAVSSWHPLVYHCLDVAAVGEALLRQRPEITARLAARLGWPHEASRRLVAFLLALHDLGKLSRPFQAKVPELWPAAVLGRLPAPPPGDPGHPVTGALLLDELADDLAPLLPRWPPRSTDDLLAPFTGHHGRPVARFDNLTTEIVDAACLRAARAFVETMRALFQPEPMVRPQPAALRTTSWQLAGLAVLAQRAGIAPLPAAAAAVIGQMGFLCTGLIFLGLMLPGYAAGTAVWLAAATLLAAAGAGWGLLASRRAQPARAALRRRLGDGRNAQRADAALALADRIEPGRAVVWAGFYAATWLLLGVAFTFFAAAFVPAAAGAPRHLAGTVAASYLAGYVAIFAPAGLVVREFAMVALLSDVMPAPAALVVAVGSRIWFTAAELLPLALLPVLGRERP